MPNAQRGLLDVHVNLRGEEGFEMCLEGVAQLQLLGGFELRCDGQVLDLPLAVQRAVAFVALRETPVPRALVCGTLWPDTPERSAHANLRTALWRLRRTRYPILKCTGQQVQVAPGVSVDVLEGVAQATRLMSVVPWFLEEDLRNFALTGDLLPGWYDDWVLAQRERVHQLRLHGLEAACQCLIDAGRFGEAIDVGLKVVADEPLRESGHRLLIAAHLGEGNMNEALRHYEKFRKRLWEELATEPSRHMEALINRYRETSR
ncbi:MAG: SARP family transcriptional regulator [Actinobacteria bacterium]|nr:SARP family transcriptional regulator [Actinomycetota bacterium]